MCLGRVEEIYDLTAKGVGYKAMDAGGNPSTQWVMGPFTGQKMILGQWYQARGHTCIESSEDPESLPSLMVDPGRYGFHIFSREEDAVDYARRIFPALLDEVHVRVGGDSECRARICVVEWEGLLCRGVTEVGYPPELILLETISAQRCRVTEVMDL